MQKDRLHWIDIAKGIGIILVIFGHTLGSNSIRHLLYTFHMPLFFFLSGILFHHKRYEHFVTFLKKNIKGLLIPYFFFAFVSLFLWYIDNTISPEELQKQVIGIFLGSSKDGYLRFNTALWFLPTLFLTRIGFWLITQITQKTKFIVVLLFLLSLIGFSLFVFFPKLSLPFGAEAAVTAIVFFGLGYLWNTDPKNIQEFILSHKKVFMIVSFVICLFVGQITYSIYELQIDLRLNRLNNYPLFYLGALSGILGTISISYVINRNRMLEYIGRKSLMLFAWHTIVFSYITKIIAITALPEIIRHIRGFFLPLFYTLTAITTILGISALEKSISVQLSARQKKKS